MLKIYLYSFKMKILNINYRPLKFKYMILICAISGIMCALPLIFSQIAILGWTAFAPMAFVLIQYSQNHSKKRAAGRFYLLGMSFFMAFGLMIFHWFYCLYPLDFVPGMTKGGALAVVLVAWIGLSAIQAAVSSIQFVIFYFLSKLEIIKKNPALKVPILACLWICFEWIQTLTWAGVPWGRFAVGQSAYPILIQGASLFGSYFVSFLMILCGSLIALGAFYFLQNRKKYSAYIFGISVLIFIINAAYGATIVYSYYDIGEPVKVAALQGNVSSNDKWSDNSLDKIMNIYDELTHEAADAGAEIILWSETSIPYTMQDIPFIENYFKYLAYDTQTILFPSIFMEKEDDNGEIRTYNAVLNVDRYGRISDEFYAKRRLVPFGEYLPMSGLVKTLVPPLAELSIFEDELSYGESNIPHETDIGKIGSLICFDSIYEIYTRENVLNGAELIAISTNDSWFKDSPAVYQHNGHAVLRAVESGRYVVRSANTGISSIISPIGEIKETLAPLLYGCVIGDVYLYDDINLYMRIGNAIIGGSFSFLIILIPISAVYKKRKNK